MNRYANASPKRGEGVSLPTLNELRRMPYADLLAYANTQDDEAAWDEISERNADASYEAQP